MYVVVVGIGEVGRYVSNVLLAEGHEVVVIDNNREALGLAEEMFDAMFLEGHAGNNETLTQARVQKADLFLAVTNNNEVNMLAAMRAKALGAKATVARCADHHYFDNNAGIHRDMMGIDLVLNPEIVLAEQMHQIVRTSYATAVRDFAGDRIEMIQIPIDAKIDIANRPLQTLEMPRNTLVAAIIRDHEIMVPRGSDVLRSGDEALIVGAKEQIPAVETFFGRERVVREERVIIVGGSEAGAALARSLLREHVDVVLFEKNRGVCEVLAEELPSQAVILNADATDLATLQEERIDHADAVVSVTRDDEVNIMTSLLAKDLGAKRVVALLNKPGLSDVCHHLGIDATLSPRLEVAKQVLRWMRSGEVAEISPVFEGRGEFLEFVVPSGAKVVGKRLRDLKFDNANICAICNEDDAFVPSGNSEIHEADRVIVFTTPAHRSKVEKLFRRGRLARLLDV